MSARHKIDVSKRSCLNLVAGTYAINKWLPPPRTLETSTRSYCYSHSNNCTRQPYKRPAIGMHYSSRDEKI
ncbi:hypothetical protein MPTK1_6g04010 [Marchantia polymorpha subsp. ruderalis]|uniref:Uncharacterized protein n=2 Tax=Marchantia polymorpha TaxID=3197 RepID=A0AAF6BNB8_MARPO|nr:hypothetical protein MARPO_0034s0117 [Marchantia polymorpha]BBN13502.1 hypothetical protein Mp_6g04010 [Marchantia polymorpha subsp. ruderalis]|eukprot:PTQ41538.1 hypothetical protein MARPO_0034s0117 [Marchantia polymorpha]